MVVANSWRDIATAASRDIGCDDATLVAAARDGDRSAFAALVGRHYPMLLALCRRALDDPHAAGDAAQEAVIAGMLGLDRLREPGRFGAWLAGIGLNVCRQWLRSRVHGAVPAGQAVDRPDPAPGPDEVAEAALVAAAVRAAINALPPGQRDATALYYLAGLTCAEIAEHLGTPVGAVKTRLHKARASLRRGLATVWKDQLMTDQPVPMRISDVRASGLDPAADPTHVVILTEEGGDRTLPIWIGQPEALAIARVLDGVELPRPTTYHLSSALLAAAGRRVAEARITALTDQVFYAQVILDDGSSVDSRPSDALNLALLAGAHVSVDPAVLRQEVRTDHSERAAALTHDARAIAEEAEARERRMHERWRGTT